MSLLEIKGLFHNLMVIGRIVFCSSEIETPILPLVVSQKSLSVLLLETVRVPTTLSLPLSEMQRSTSFASSPSHTLNLSNFRKDALSFLAPLIRQGPPRQSPV